MQLFSSSSSVDFWHWREFDLLAWCLAWGISFLVSAVFHFPWASCVHVIRTLGEESYCLSANMLCCWCCSCAVSCCPPASVSRLVRCYCVTVQLFVHGPISPYLLASPCQAPEEFEVWVQVASMPRSLARVLPFSTNFVGNNTQGRPLWQV